jgi:hypothetical protein
LQKLGDLRIGVYARIRKIDGVDLIAFLAEKVQVWPPKLDVGPYPMLAGRVGTE